MNTDLETFVTPVFLKFGKTAVLSLALLSASMLQALAQGQFASVTVVGSGIGPEYSYSLSFNNGASATSPVGTIWYAWTPGYFYLPGVPDSATAPVGWEASVTANSIEFWADSPASYISAGQSLSGFGFTVSFTPDQLAASENAGLSVAYSGYFGPDGGQTFSVAAGAVPEPSTCSLLALGIIGARYAARRRDAGR